MHSTVFLARRLSLSVNPSLVLALSLPEAVSISLPIGWRLRSRLSSTECIWLYSLLALSLFLSSFLLCLLFLFLCRFLFLNEWRLRRRLQLNAFGIAPSPFRFRFQLNDGFVAGFLLTVCIRMYSLLALFCFLSVSLFLLFLTEKHLRRRLRLHAFSLFFGFASD
jgi:hypothetical protein